MSEPLVLKCADCCGVLASCCDLCTLYAQDEHDDPHLWICEHCCQCLVWVTGEDSDD